MNDDALLDLLRRSAATPEEVPDAAFVDALEQRLLAGPAHATVVPLTQRRRRLGRSGAIAVIAMVSVAGAAAAAGVVPNPFADETAAPPVTTVAGTTSVPPSAASSTIDTPTPSAVPPPATTVPAASTTVPVTTSVPTTAATTTQPATTQPGTTPPTASTEPPVPVTMTLTCTPDGSVVACAWSTPPTAPDHYVVLRSGGGGAGRSYTVPVGTTNWTDTTAVPGVRYTYLVHAMDAQDHSQGRSTVVSVDCCAAG